MSSTKAIVVQRYSAIQYASKHAHNPCGREFRILPGAQPSAAAIGRNPGRSKQGARMTMRAPTGAQPSMAITVMTSVTQH